MSPPIDHRRLRVAGAASALLLASGCSSAPLDEVRARGSSEAALTLTPIDFCTLAGAGPSSRICVAEDGYPTTRTLSIVDRGAAEGIATPDTLSFAANAQPFVRLVNHSSFEVSFWGNLTPGKLFASRAGVAEEVTLGVGVPGVIRLEAYPGEQRIVRLVREPPASSAGRRPAAFLRGTAKQPGFGPMAAELELRADGDPTCPEWRGEAPVWPSVDECAGKSVCGIALRAVFRVRHPSTGELINEYTILPPQCGYVGARYHSHFAWDAASRGISYVGEAAWIGGGTSIHLLGTASGLRGTAWILSAEGTVDLTFSGAE